jgi:PUA domain protein
MKIKSRHHLKGSAAKKIVGTMEPLMKDPEALKSASLELAETDSDVDLIFVDGKPFFMMMDERPFFTVLGAIELASMKNRVVVDSGAVRFIVNGADVMAPGVVFADPEIAEGDLVVIAEEKHGKPLAIGRALRHGPNMKGEGKAVKSLHHVGDLIWKGLV